MMRSGVRRHEHLEALISNSGSCSRQSQIEAVRWQLSDLAQRSVQVDSTQPEIDPNAVCGGVQGATQTPARRLHM
eukprot:2286011-Rhodomonas_salina.1